MILPGNYPAFMRLFLLLPLGGTLLLATIVFGIVFLHIVVLPTLGVALLVLIVSYIWRICTRNAPPPKHNPPP